MWLKALLLLKHIDGRCSYRETWFPSLSWKECVLCHRVLLAGTRTSTLFICSLKLGVDTEKPWFQKAALNTLGYWILNSFWLDHFSVFGLRLQSVLQKSFGLSQLATVDDYFTTFFYFWTVDLIFRWASFEIPFKMSGAILWLLPIFINGMATFGWCSTEKPALFTWPSHVWDRVSSFGLVPFYHSEFIPLATVSVRVPFLFPLLPICFSPLLPTFVQLPEEQVAHNVLLCFMSTLGSFLYAL